jgi:hypothetical protein
VLLFLEKTIFFNTAGVHFFNVFLIFGRGLGGRVEDKLDVALVTSFSFERGVVLPRCIAEESDDDFGISPEFSLDSS